MGLSKIDSDLTRDDEGDGEFEVVAIKGVSKEDIRNSVLEHKGKEQQLLNFKRPKKLNVQATLRIRLGLALLFPFSV